MLAKGTSDARLLLPALLILLLTVSSSRAEEDEGHVIPPEQVREQVAAWLDDLRADDFATREAARQGLERYGDEARDLLEARRDDEDMEVRRTVRMLLERGEGPEVRPPAPPGDLQALGRVTLHAKGTLSYLLRQLGEGVGATFGIPEEVGDTHHAVALDDVPFFEALETIAAKAQLVAHAPFDAGGHLGLEAFGSPEEAPAACDGPLRVRVVEVTSVRTLTPPTRYRYVVALDLHWIPSVQLVTWRTPTEVRARGAGDRTLAPSSTMRANTTYGVSPSSRRARLHVHLEAEDGAPLDRLETLSFALPVRLRHDRRTVRFGPFASPARLDLPLEAAVVSETDPPGGEEHVTLRALERPDGDRGPWMVDLLARLRGETARNSIAVGLETADGTVRAAAGGSRFPGADGTVGFLARAYGQWEEPPVAVRVTWFGLEEEGHLTFELVDVPLR